MRWVQFNFTCEAQVALGVGWPTKPTMDQIWRTFSADPNPQPPLASFPRTLLSIRRALLRMPKVAGGDLGPDIFVSDRLIGASRAVKDPTQVLRFSTSLWLETVRPSGLPLEQFLAEGFRRAYEHPSSLSIVVFDGIDPFGVEPRYRHLLPDGVKP